MFIYFRSTFRYVFSRLRYVFSKSRYVFQEIRYVFDRFIYVFAEIRYVFPKRRYVFSERRYVFDRFIYVFATFRYKREMEVGNGGEEGVDGLGYYYLGAYSMLLSYIQVKDFFNIESYWVSIKVNLEKLDLNFF